jgi:hypothetical protein
VAQVTDAPEQHRAAQDAIVAQMVGMLRTQVWPEFDPARINATLPRVAALVAALVRRYGMASAAQAASYYKQERVAAGVAGRFTSIPAEPPGLAEITQQLQWATSGLWGAPLGPARAPAAFAPGPAVPSAVPPMVAPSEAEQVALRKVEAVAERAVLSASRDTLVNNAKRDRYARGWARVPEPGACSFCLMLASRGAVYVNKASAGVVDAKTKYGGDATGEANSYHDHCRCHVVPLFQGDTFTPSQQVKDAQALWQKSTKGRSGHDARVAFRQAVEGREVTGTSGAKPKPKADAIGSNMTRAQVEHQIKLLEGLKPSAYRTKRLAELRKLAGK